MNDKGSRVHIRGPIAGDAGEQCELLVTVTQRSTGAVALGFTRLRFNGGDQVWEAVAHVNGAAKFVPGTATAVAAARSSLRGKATDAHQWLVEVTLVR